MIEASQLDGLFMNEGRADIVVAYVTIFVLRIGTEENVNLFHKYLLLAV